VLPNGSAILPVLSNPGPDSHGPGQPAAAAPGQPAASVVSADAEAFAAAGGRMTSWEWQQLQRFRDAVVQSRSVPEASPLLLEPGQLSRSGLSGTDPSVSFSVKQAVLTPHRRLMDSVCRFAFPATHSLLAAGWQLQPARQQLAAGSSTAAAAAAAGGMAAQAQPASQSIVMPQPRPVQQTGTAEQAAPRHHPAGQQQQLDRGGLQRSEQQHAQQGTCMVLPVPVPVLQQLVGSGSTAGGAAPAQQVAAAGQGPRGSAGSDHGSSGGHTQQQAAQGRPSAADGPGDPGQLSRLGSSSGSVSAAAGAMQAPAGAVNWSAASTVQLRIQAAAGAAAQRLSSGQGSALGLDPNQSWGSALNSDLQANSAQGPHQQQQQGPGQVSMASWGTGVSSQQPGGANSQHAASTATQLAGQQVEAAGTAPAACTGQQAAFGLGHSQAGTRAAAAAAAAMGPAGCSDGGSTDGEAAGASKPAGDAARHQQQVQQPPQQPSLLLEGAGSLVAARQSDGMNLSWGSWSQAGASQAVDAGSILDLPAVWQPSNRNSSSRTRSTPPAAHVAKAADLELGSEGTEAGQGKPAIGEPAAAGNVGRTSAGSNSSSSSPAVADLTALQRALVEDFVLYEEASAARQHVVGILVAVEQGDAAAGQRLLAPTCAELIAATAPAAVPNRLAPYLSAPAVVSAAASATGSGLSPAAVSAAVACAAAEEYCRHTRGISRLLGSASSSRAALEASPKQLRQQRQQQQMLLVRALQQVSTRVPWLSRLLAPLQQSMGLDAEGAQEGTAAATDRPEGNAAQHAGVAGGRAAGATAATALQPRPSGSQHGQGAGSAGQEQQAAQQQQQEQDEPCPMEVQEQAAVGDPPGVGGVSAQPAAAGDESSCPDAAAGQQELKAAVVELIMQLPELLHGLPGPALLTFEQYKQRHTQAQQLAAHAMQLLLPGAVSAEEGGGPPAAAADGVAAELAASGLLAAASAAMAASQGLAAGDAAAGINAGEHHSPAGHLFANILDSLRAPGQGDAANQPEAAAAGAAAAEAALSAAYGSRSAASAAASGFLSRTAAFAAANRLAEGLIRPPSGLPASSIGLSRAGSLAGPGQLGAWRLPASGGGAGAAGGLTTPGSMAGMGMFAPTGTGALLSGGLLAEGGVAGDSIMDDVLHGNVRRITCHGLYELCAALAQPAGPVGSPPQTGPQGFEGLGDGNQAASHLDSDDSCRSAEGRTVTGQHVAQAVATVAATAAAIESNRRSSSTSSMGPPAAVVGAKRRLSSTLDEPERPLKH